MPLRIASIPPVGLLLGLRVGGLLGLGVFGFGVGPVLGRGGLLGSTMGPTGGRFTRTIGLIGLYGSLLGSTIILGGCLFIGVGAFNLRLPVVGVFLDPGPPIPECFTVGLFTLLIGLLTPPPE